MAVPRINSETVWRFMTSEAQKMMPHKAVPTTMPQSPKKYAVYTPKPLDQSWDMAVPDKDAQRRQRVD